MLNIYLPPALWNLLKLQANARLRRSMKQLRSPRQRVSTIVVAILFLLYVVQVYIATTMNQLDSNIDIERWAPIGMLGILFMKLLGICLDREKTGASFRGEETYQLLGGPFTRDQVRLYRITAHAISIFGTSMFAAIFFRFHVPSYVSALTGSFLAMLFTYLIYNIAAIAAQNVNAKTFSRSRGIIGGVALSVGLWCFVQAAFSGKTNVAFLYAFGDSLHHIAESWCGAIVLAPFTLFTKVIISETWIAWFTWTVPASLVVAGTLKGLLLFELWLVEHRWMTERNREYLDTERWQIAKSKRIARELEKLKYKILWLAGSGPIVWRQMKALGRLRGGVVWLLLPMVVALSVGGYVAFAPEDGGFQSITVIVILTSVFLPGLLPFDFRSDLGGMSTLKMMPIPSWSVVLGQIAVPTILLLSLQYVSLLALLIRAPELRDTIVVTMLFLIPTNITILALENLIFLLHPYRVADFDMQATVRRVVMLMTKFCVLFVAALLSLIVGLGIAAIRWGAAQFEFANAWFNDWQMTLIIVAQWGALVFVSWIVVVSTTWAYDRFDLNDDMPL